MNISEALKVADEGMLTGLRGMYPMAAQVLAEEVRRLRVMTTAKPEAGCSSAPPIGRPEWDDDGMPMNLLAAAEDADEWLALIERLHGLRRWKFSEPDSLTKLRACRAELRRIMTPGPAANRSRT